MPDQPTSMRLPESWLDDAETLSEHYQRTGEYAAFGNMTRATVLRLALQEGLRVLKERRKADDEAWMAEATGGRAG